MLFYLYRVNQFVVFCWMTSILGAQQMSTVQANQGTSYFFYQRPEFPRDCEEVYNQCSSDTTSGVYLIKPDGFPEPFEVYCNNSNSQGWTVILRRNDGHVDFCRNYDEYKEGFGFLSHEFWIGNDKLSYFTNQKNYELRIDFTNSEGSSCFATYNRFRTSDEFSNFKFTNIGQYSGNADDCITLCPRNAHPGDCTCQKTCANPSSCLDACSSDDTCICSDGFYLQGGECIPLIECPTGCSVDGIDIPEGASYVNADCTRRGVCTNSQLIWDDTYSCSVNEVCEERNNVRQCYSDASDCLDIYNAGFSESGVYTVMPTNWPGSPFQVYCNMTEGGGWTVLQRRLDGTVDFYRNWTSYKEGFGSVDHEHWLGNDKLHYLTNQKRYTIRIDLVNLDNLPHFANFDFFRINDENDNYRLSELGTYGGTAGDSLSYHHNQQFSTYDQDHDSVSYDSLSYNCAVIHAGAWWYKSCIGCNLNGLYRSVLPCSDEYVFWYNVPVNNCNKFAEMKIRPL